MAGRRSLDAITTGLVIGCWGSDTPNSSHDRSSWAEMRAACLVHHDLAIPNSSGANQKHRTIPNACPTRRAASYDTTHFQLQPVTNAALDVTDLWYRPPSPCLLLCPTCAIGSCIWPAELNTPRFEVCRSVAIANKEIVPM